MSRKGRVSLTLFFVAAMILSVAPVAFVSASPAMGVPSNLKRIELTSSINGEMWASQVLVSSLDLEADGYYELLNLKWNVPADGVSYVINPAEAPEDSSVEVEAAFEAWDAVVSIELYDNPEIDSGAGPSTGRPDYENVISWGRLRGKGVVAMASIWYDTSTVIDGNYLIVDADIIFNTLQPWGIDPDCEGPDPMPTNAFDVCNVAVHEVGHLCGLGDLYDASHSELTMYGYTDLGEVKKISLGLGDKLGVQEMYGAPTPTPPELSVTVSAPRLVIEGDTFPVTAKIGNSGTETAEGVSATISWIPTEGLSINDQITQDVGGIIGGGSGEASWTLSADRQSINRSYTITVAVDYTGGNSEGDGITVSVVTKMPTYLIAPEIVGELPESELPNYWTIKSTPLSSRYKHYLWDNWQDVINSQIDSYPTNFDREIEFTTYDSSSLMGTIDLASIETFTGYSSVQIQIRQGCQWTFGRVDPLVSVQLIDVTAGNAIAYEWKTFSSASPNTWCWETFDEVIELESSHEYVIRLHAYDIWVQQQVLCRWEYVNILPSLSS